MQIILRQSNVEEALRDYVAKQGICILNKKVDISFTAGRRGSGLTAEVIIDDAPPQTILGMDRAIAKADSTVQTTVQVQEKALEKKLEVVDAQVIVSQEPLPKTDEAGNVETTPLSAVKTSSLFSS